ncbi:hypothetical protein [Deinococcus sp. 23YEL01]|uniref:hypothetical protein n=1 Tax=Deinococcus sp. 23YEL01 TaxID=2745871 RepID=UPI001E462023|nr:hypothetical protein [Deinococcus sp. 23YEL01]MCD0168018.1 hypothetical protein [Deinococcus sp. 23YEL01]
MLGLFLLCGVSAQSFNFPVSDNSGDIKLASGYNPTQPDRMISPCIEFETSSNSSIPKVLIDKRDILKTGGGVGASNVRFELSLISNMEDLYTALRIDAKAKLKTRFLGASGSASYQLDQTLKKFTGDYVLAMTAYIQYKPVSLEGFPVLKDSIVKTYKMDQRGDESYKNHYQDFVNRCGAYYINSIQKQASTTMLISLKSETVDSRRKVDAAITMSAGNAAVSGSFNASIQEIANIMIASDRFQILFLGSGGSNISGINADLIPEAFTSGQLGNNVIEKEQKIQSIASKYIGIFNTYAKSLSWENAIPEYFTVDYQPDSLPFKKASKLSVRGINESRGNIWLGIHDKVDKLYQDALNLAILPSVSMSTSGTSSGIEVTVKIPDSILPGQREKYLAAADEVKQDYVKKLISIVDKTARGALACFNHDDEDICKLPEYDIISAMRMEDIPVATSRIAIDGLRGLIQPTLTPVIDKNTPVIRLDLSKVTESINEKYNLRNR